MKELIKKKQQQHSRITEYLSQECKEMLLFLTWKSGGNHFLNLNSHSLGNAKINAGA